MQHASNVLADNIRFHIDGIAGLFRVEICVLVGVGDYRGGESVGRNGCHGQTDSVYGYRTLLDHPFQEFIGEGDSWEDTYGEPVEEPEGYSPEKNLSLNMVQPGDQGKLAAIQEILNTGTSVDELAAGADPLQRIREILDSNC